MNGLTKSRKTPTRNTLPLFFTTRCGTAGGRLQGQGPGTAGAAYQDTVNAKLGDLGSKLPPAPSGTTWTAGKTAEVAWTVKAYHGGGASALQRDTACPALVLVAGDTLAAQP